MKAAVTAAWSDRYSATIAAAGVVAEFHDSGEGFAYAFHADREVDLVILDLALATPALAGHLGPHGPRVLAFGDAANAGVALAANLADFIPDAPTPDDLTAAIAAALAPAAAGEVGDLSDRALARLGALGVQAAQVADALARIEEASSESATVPPVDPAQVRALIRARRTRDRFFRPDIFGEPAWDMLLDLAASAAEGRAVAVSSLCIAAAVPTTTALRWIKTLCDAGLFERRDDPLDARRAFIDLSAEATRAMARYLAQI
jgi:hypothetical protein